MKAFAALVKCKNTTRQTARVPHSITFVAFLTKDLPKDLFFDTMWSRLDLRAIARDVETTAHIYCMIVDVLVRLDLVNVTLGVIQRGSVAPIPAVHAHGEADTSLRTWIL